MIDDDDYGAVGVTPCSLMDVHPRSGGIHYIQLQVRREAEKQAASRITGAGTEPKLLGSLDIILAI
jgi:hypothetical protein